MSNTYYNRQYFTDRDYLDFHIARSLEILARENNIKKILDVGCGTGKLVKFLNQQGFSAIGCDNSKIAVETAQKINGKKTIVVASATELPFKTSSFDLVISISTIEHLTMNEANDFLDETYRVIKPGGFIFMVTPNFSSPLRYLLREKWFGYSDPTHINFFTPHSLSLLLKENGFGNVRLRFKTPYKNGDNYNTLSFFSHLPTPIKRLCIYLFFSTPLSLIRDSFWIAAQKR